MVGSSKHDLFSKKNVQSGREIGDRDRDDKQKKMLPKERRAVTVQNERHFTYLAEQKRNKIRVLFFSYQNSTA